MRGEHGGPAPSVDPAAPAAVLRGAPGARVPGVARGVSAAATHGCAERFGRHRDHAVVG